MKNKIIDLFCGCGGLSLGFEMAGFESVLAIDMWKDAIESYNFNPILVSLYLSISLLDGETINNPLEHFYAIDVLYGNVYKLISDGNGNFTRIDF